MIKHIQGNALDWAERVGYCMVHVCNNKGGFGGGKTALATQVKSRWPSAYKNYIESCYALGSASANTCDLDDNLSVINMVAQDGYGPRWKGVKYFDDKAFLLCLKKIASRQSEIKENWKIHTIVIPFKMGADRAGGDWEWIIGKIEKILGEYFEILVVEYESKA